MKNIEELFKDIVIQIELHDVEGITKCFSEGLDPNEMYDGEPLIYELTSEYTRSPKFKDCVRTFVDYGLEFEDKALLAVLLDDPHQFKHCIEQDPGLVHASYSLHSAYTPLFECSLLHICAEFNHTKCAQVLLENRADINAKAGFDAHGFGGHTPIFHTVNQNSNQSAEMMQLLLKKGADLTVSVKGLIWGKDYPWETFIPAVNPISYAMMGLLPQMHRNEKTISKTIASLVKYAYDIDYTPSNIPNKYLQT